MLLRSCSDVAKELLGCCSGTLGAAQELLASFLDVAEELQKWLPLDDSWLPMSFLAARSS